MIRFLEIRNNIVKLNACYILNQGESMNNYKFTEGREINELNIDKKVEKFIFNLKNYLNNLYKVSTFEMEEKDRINKKIQNKFESINVGDNNSIYLNENNSVHIDEYEIFENDQLKKFTTIKNQCDIENKELNFALRSLLMQKKYYLENFDLSKAVKIGDKVTTITNKIINQKEKIRNINEEILEIENDFFNKYLSFIVALENSAIVIDKKLNYPKDFPKGVVDYYRINKILYFLESYLKEINVEEIIKILNTDLLFKNSIGDVFESIIIKLRNVGTDI